ncbi:hypothetical protein GCM10009789_83090 [Kribbella sancticallisti]|uniref:YbaB/EbfC DNA-binding family protein n=1 Tax=Kribbella sancticallisti TaxID=460087 RepID=A0ABN2EWB3_9ACTN
MNEIQPSDEVRQLTQELGERLDRGRQAAAATRGAAGVRAIELWRQRELVRRARDNSLATDDPTAAQRVHGIHLVEIDIELTELLDRGVPPHAAQSVALAGSASALLRDLVTTQGVESRSVNEWLARFDKWMAKYGEIEPPPESATDAGEADGR